MENIVVEFKRKELEEKMCISCYYNDCCPKEKYRLVKCVISGRCKRHKFDFIKKNSNRLTIKEIKEGL